MRWLSLLAILIALPVSGQEGRALYLERCASCHGGNLEGHPDWMVRKPDGKLPAPPHDASGHTWHHSDEQLLRIVRGLAAIAPGYQTDMPAFGSDLTDAQIIAILDYIKSTWPEREREFQAAR
jgi:mono/diheme cytochrome c family protein